MTLALIIIGMILVLGGVAGKRYAMNSPIYIEPFIGPAFIGGAALVVFGLGGAIL